MAVFAAIAVADGGETSTDTAREFAMCRANACINHVGGYTGAGLRAGVATVEWQGALIDAIEAPRQWRNAVA